MMKIKVFIFTGALLGIVSWHKLEDKIFNNSCSLWLTLAYFCIVLPNIEVVNFVDSMQIVPKHGGDFRQKLYCRPLKLF